MKYQVISDI